MNSTEKFAYQILNRLNLKNIDNEQEAIKKIDRYVLENTALRDEHNKLLWWILEACQRMESDNIDLAFIKQGYELLEQAEETLVKHLAQIS